MNILMTKIFAVVLVVILIVNLIGFAMGYISMAYFWLILLVAFGFLKLVVSK